ncbi:leucyl aminopeptidase [bacterium]|nr:leucyl aminopeptidase [bacterium]
MRISIVAKPAKTLKPEITCYFLNPDVRYAANVPAALANVNSDANPPVIVPAADRLLLGFNLPVYKYYEEHEARRVAGGSTVRELRRMNKTVATWILDGKFPLEHFTQLVTGALMADYRFLDYKSQKPAQLAKEQLVIVAGANAPAFKRELARLQAIDAGVRVARDLANTPANDLVPLDLADFARRLAKEHGLSFKALSAAQLEKGGYVGLTQVGKGSVHPPVMFTLTYQPKVSNRQAQPLCLVGKGLCFDAGGVNLKPWEGMWNMKADMGGAAAVIGAMKSIALLKPRVEVTAVIGSAINVLDGKAVLPGDILRYRNGRTVEIQNTDAEGRLVLADALLYSQQILKQRRIVDFATLTGACARALGVQYIGLLSRAQGLKADVERAAEISGENTWELPLHPEYRLQLKSSIADVRNIGGAIAGAQTAAWFLHEFIEEKTEYVHLDIAGTFLTEKEDKYWSQAGMTGSGVRLAVALAELSAG